MLAASPPEKKLKGDRKCMNKHLEMPGLLGAFNT
jgi:hypothetical protein